MCIYASPRSREEQLLRPFKAFQGMSGLLQGRRAKAAGGESVCARDPFVAAGLRAGQRWMRSRPRATRSPEMWPAPCGRPRRRSLKHLIAVVEYKAQRSVV